MTYLIYESRTQRAYKSEANSLLDLVIKFIRWDMEGDKETIDETLKTIRCEADAIDYLNDRGSIVLTVDDITEF